MAVAVYGLIASVSIIGSGLGIAVNNGIDELFAFASNPLTGLAIGILATVLTQSSSSTTSIVVGMVAGGLSIETAVPILIGANLGTTLTSTLVAFASSGSKDEFRRAFSAASVHDVYNLLSVAIILPLELAFGILGRVSQWFAEYVTVNSSVASVFVSAGDSINAATAPPRIGLEMLLETLGEAGGVVMIGLGVVTIFVAIKSLAKILRSLLVGTAEKLFHRAVGHNSLAGVVAGMTMTAMVQSSSTTTSLTVPLAAADKFALKQIYPFTVGANVGTTLTALVAAFAFTGPASTAALTAASVHLFYNVFSALVIFATPLRLIPLHGARALGRMGSKRTWYVVAWIVTVFVFAPSILLLIGLNTSP